MRFVLDHLAGLPEIATLPGFEDAKPELVEAILTEAARFAGEVLAPLNATGDRQGCRWDDGEGRHAGWLPRGVSAVHRSRLARDAGQPRHRRPGNAGVGVERGGRDVEIRQSGLLAVPDADHGRRRGARASRVGRAQAALPAEDGRWRVDWNHEPDRAAGGLGPLGRAHAGRAGRRPLSPVRIEDIHHLGRARRRGEHRPPRPRAIAGRARGHARDFAIRRAEIPGQSRRQPRARATTLSAPPSNTSSAYMARPRR